jgi:hypothetical protein
VERGFVFLLLSPEYLTSQGCARERTHAFKILGSKPLNNIVPIIVKDQALVMRQLPSELQDIKCVNLTDGPIGPAAGDLHNKIDLHYKIDALLYDLKKRPVA